MTDHLSDILFAPTEAAVANLEREGIGGEAVQLVGDVMFDAARFYAARVADDAPLLASAGLVREEFVLATVHRAENTDYPSRLGAIVEALDRIAAIIPVVLPLHPRTRGLLERAGLSMRGVRIIDPVGYLDMIALERSARLIVTDSGGVQKEAYFHGVRCVTLRDETEWVELVEAGWNRLAPPSSAEVIVRAIYAALTSPLPPDTEPLYGAGHAAERIARYLVGARCS